MDEEPPWGVVALGVCGVAGVVAGLLLYWFVLVEEIPRGVSIDTTEGLEPSVYPGPRGIELWPVGLLGVVAVRRASRGRRFGTPLAALTVCALAVVFGRQLLAFPEMRPYQAAGLLVADSLLVGCLAAFALYRYRRHRLAGAVLCLAGLVVTGGVLGRIRDATGADGRYGYLGLSPVPFVALGGATLLLVGGALLYRLADSPLVERRSERRPLRWRDRLDTVPVSVPILALSAVAGVAVGSRLEWLLVNPGLEPDRGGAVPTVHAGVPLDLLSLVGVTAAVLGAFAVTVRSGRRRHGGRLLVAAGLLSVLTPLWWRITVPFSRIASPGLYVTLCAGGALLVAGALLSESDRTAGGFWGREEIADRESRLSAVPWATTVVALVGAALVGAATRFHWVVRLGDVEPAAAGVGPMEIGAAGSHEALLVLAGTGVLAALVVAALLDHRRGGLLLLGTGLLAAVQVAWRLLATVGADSLAGRQLVVGPGAYLALGGATTLLLAGAVLHSTDAPAVLTDASHDRAAGAGKAAELASASDDGRRTIE